MKSKSHTLSSTALASVLLCTGLLAEAAEYQILSHPSLQNLLPGPDGYWATADDISFGGLNPLGSATTFFDLVGNYGGVIGSFSTNNSGQATFGENLFTDGLFSLETSNNGVPFFNFPTEQIFDATLNSSTTLQSDRTATSTFHMVDNFGQKLSFAGSYIWLVPGDNPADHVGDPDFLAHIDFLMTLLPAGWTWFSTGLESYVMTAGSLTGVEGFSTKAVFSIDPAATPVPNPAALPLLVSALGGLGVWRRRSVGSRVA